MLRPHLRLRVLWC